MTSGVDIAYVAVDWGTSQLRIWLLSSDGNVLDTHKSKRGMRTLARHQFASVLETTLDERGVEENVPVIMCGMVGSRQGWQEAPYIDVACNIKSVAENAVRVDGLARDVRILPGVANRSQVTPDVMRSEETQLLGLYDKLGSELSGLICMPGSHAKWVRFEKGVVIDFATSLTGELFAALGSASVLKHALGNVSGKVDEHSSFFVDAVRASLKEPATILTRLFAARPHSLLHNMKDEDASAYISGTIIGQDIAGAMARFSPMHAVTLVGSGHLGSLYSKALEVAGLRSSVHDGDDLAIGGLSFAARSIWPERTTNHKPTLSGAKS